MIGHRALFPGVCLKWWCGPSLPPNVPCLLQVDIDGVNKIAHQCKNRIDRLMKMNEAALNRKVSTILCPPCWFLPHSCPVSRACVEALSSSKEAVMQAGSGGSTQQPICIGRAQVCLWPLPIPPPRDSKPQGSCMHNSCSLCRAAGWAPPASAHGQPSPLHCPRS